MKNLLEELVIREFERLLPSVEGFCGCGQCRDDVLVYTLNRLRPHYVASVEGEVITRTAMEGDQHRSDVAVLLLEGFRKVQKHPREGHPAP